jgi:Asp-tRNA(Asn)/Glu-tRNA(Gln) amidotransferase A subunit family amidase
MLGVLAEARFPRGSIERPLRVAWCPRPEARPVDPDLASSVAGAVRQLAALGHHIEQVELPLARWKDAFGPLVLEEEGRLRGHLLPDLREMLTTYEVAALEAAAAIDEATIAASRSHHRAVQQRLDEFLNVYDLIVTPATAVPAFPVGERPRIIAGENVDALWGAFPFTAPFNVAGTPAASIPCGFVRNLPVGIQLVCRRGRDALLLDISEDLEEALGLDTTIVIERLAARTRSELVS